MRVKVKDWLSLSPVDRYMSIRRAYVATQKRPLLQQESA